MREVFQHRPLLLVAVGFILGLSLREYPWNALFLLPLAFLAGSGSRCLIVAAGFVVGALIGMPVMERGIKSTEYVEGEAAIITVPRLYPDRIAYEIELKGLRLTVSEEVSGRSLGDRFRLTALVHPLREGSEQYMLAKGIVGRCEPIQVQVVSQGPAWYRWAAGVRQAFVSFTKASMSPDHAAVLDALCFNVEGGLSDKLESELRNTGAIHIISASGLHVLLIAAALEGLFGLLPVPRWVRLVLIGLLLAFYAAAAGLQPAILRSILMSMAALSAYIWRREGDLLSLLSLAAVLYLLYDPLGIYNIGFQVSFLTVAAFGLFGSVEESSSRTAWGLLRDQTAQAFRTTFVAYGATVPILAFYFGAVSIVAIPANLFIVPAVSVLVVGGMAAFGFSFLSPGVGALVAGYVLDPLVGFLQWLLGLLGNLAISTLPGVHFSGYILVAVYALMLLWVRERVRPA